jgi:hypothetical protein
MKGERDFLSATAMMVSPLCSDEENVEEEASRFVFFVYEAITGHGSSTKPLVNVATAV